MPLQATSREDLRHHRQCGVPDLHPHGYNNKHVVHLLHNYFSFQVNNQVQHREGEWGVLHLV